MTRTARMIRSGEVVLATEGFGDPADPAILLIMGATASMLWWPEAFCERLAAAGRFVIRYDNRDTGASDGCPPGAPDYDITDLAADGLAVLDGWGVAAADVVGASLGGMIGQLMALMAPGRVQSLTLIGTSAFDEDDPDLPAMDPAVMAHFAGLATLDWADREAVVAFNAETMRISAADPGFDLAAARDLAGREFDRARDPAAALNHSILGGGEAYAGRLPEIRQRALVIHGRRDPILSFAHGQALARKLPHSRLMALEAGHEFTPAILDQVAEAILDHIR